MPEVVSATVSLQTESASLRLVNTVMVAAPPNPNPNPNPNPKTNPNPNQVSAAADDSDFRRRVAATLKDAGFEAPSVDTTTAP